MNEIKMQMEKVLLDRFHGRTIINSTLIKDETNIEIRRFKLDDNKSYIIKFLKDKKAVERRKVDSSVCKYIKKRSADFPCTDISDLILYDNNSAFLLEQAIEGIPLETIPEAVPQNIQLFNQLAHILKIMHKIEVGEEILTNNSEVLNRTKTWHDYINSCLKDYIERIQIKGYLTLNIIESIKDYWYRNEEIFDNIEQYAIVHNDLTDNNIIVNVDQHGYYISGIIDFERSIIGDPVKEISKLVWLFRRFPEGAETFMKNYFLKYNSNIHTKIILYLILDMLNHIQQQDVLLQNRIWEKYLREEEELLFEIVVKGEKRLW